MRDNDRTSLIRHRSVGCERIDIERIQVDVDERSLCPNSLRREPWRRTDITRHDDFVTGTNPERPKGQFERRSPELTATPPCKPKNAAMSRSNRSTQGPWQSARNPALRLPHVNPLGRS